MACTLPSHGQLGDAELLHPRCALPADLDEPVLGPDPPPRVGVVPRVGGVQVGPGSHHQQIVDLRGSATGHRLLRHGDQFGSIELGEVCSPAVELGR